jgi:hypothetical protein
VTGGEDDPVHADQPQQHRVEGGDLPVGDATDQRDGELHDEPDEREIDDQATEVARTRRVALRRRTP